MLAFFSAIPVVGNIITFIIGKVFDAKVAITQAKTGADRDVAVEVVKTAAVAEQARVSGLAVIAGNKLLTILVVSFAAPLVIFEWKVVVYDIVLGLGSTDPIKGQVAEWANVIIASLFGTTTAVTLGRMWFNRNTS